MVLRYNKQRHSNPAVPTGDTPFTLTPPSGGDLRGNPRILMGVEIVGGDDQNRQIVTSPDWGPRRWEGPPVGIGGAVAGLRTKWLRHPQFVHKNQIVEVAVTQDSGAAQGQTVDLIYMEGDIPAAIMATVAKTTSLFFNGTANPGTFGFDPTESRRLEMEADSVWWPIEMASVGAAIGSSSMIRYPEADGQGPFIASQLDVLQEHPWAAVPPIAPVNNGDTVDWFAQGTATPAEGWVTFVMSENGAIPQTIFQPPYGTIA